MQPLPLRLFFRRRFQQSGCTDLVDTPEENGAFICVPGMHNIVDEWLDTLPEDVTPNSQLQIKGEGQAQEVLLGGKTKRVAAEAGDLVICKPLCKS